MNLLLLVKLFYSVPILYKADTIPPFRQGKFGFFKNSYNNLENNNENIRHHQCHFTQDQKPN